MSQPGSVALRCDYCGAMDALPADATQRVWALRQRAQALWWAKDTLRGQDATMCQRVEGAWLKGTALAALGPLTLIVVLIIAPAVYMGFTEMAIVGGGLIGQLLSVIMGMLGGFLIAKHRYRAMVRPHILARVPSAAGRPARCHCCGAELPYAPDAFATCGYCQSTNLVSPEMARDRAALLEAEAQCYRARAAGNVPLIQDHLEFMGRAIAAGNYFGLLAFFGLGALWVGLMWG